MTRYVCGDCGSMIDKLPIVSQLLVDDPYPMYEECEDWECKCGGTYEEAIVCKSCGEVVALDDTDRGICMDCYSKMFTLKTVFAYDPEIIVGVIGAEKVMEHVNILLEQVEEDMKQRLTPKGTTLFTEFQKSMLHIIDLDDFAELLLNGGEEHE